MDELDPDSRLSDLEDAIAFGNHKGSTKNQDKLKKLVEKDVTYRYGLVLPLDKMKLIPWGSDGTHEYHEPEYHQQNWTYRWKG